MSEIERILNNIREKKLDKSFLSKFSNKLKNFSKKIFKNYYEFKKFKKKKNPLLMDEGLVTTDTKPPGQI